MKDSTHCLLYILTDETIETVQSAIDKRLRGSFGDLIVEAPVFRNDFFDPHLSHGLSRDPIGGAAHTAELAAVDGDPRHAPRFQEGVVKLIHDLRDLGFVVTASCEFEDFIVAETGSNGWT